jgi:hypothetical protein
MEQERTMLMRQCFIVSLLCIVAGLASAQDVPRGEIFAGYSYINADTSGLTSRLDMNGADFSFVENFNQRGGIETNFSTYYKYLNIGGTGVSLRDFNILFGPRLHYKWAFVHALVGLDDFGGSALGGSSTNGAFGAAIGGGAVFKITKRIGLEGGGDYLVTRHNLLGGSAITQNHGRAIAGIVFTFGSHRRIDRTDTTVNVRACAFSADSAACHRRGYEYQPLGHCGEARSNGRSGDY